jgi:hypothetical protein
MRYALITDKTTPAQMDFIFSIYRDPRNRYGQYMHVLVGSKIVGEARSFKNVRQVHILDPHFNNSSTEQAIGRAIRMFSHLDLPENKRVVEVFRHASVLRLKGRHKSNWDSDDLRSKIGYDMRMYQLSEDKDVEIRSVTRLIKETSPLCPIFRSDVGEENSRLCDYQQCEYECTQIHDATPGYVLEDKDLDKSSYRLYYSDDDVKTTVEYIAFLLMIRTEYTLQEIIELAGSRGSNDLFVLIRSLMYVIQGQMMFRDRFGIPRYLKQRGDLYYLTERVNSRPGDNMMGLYISTPRIDDSLSFNESVAMEGLSGDLIALDDLSRVSDAQIHELLDSMEDDVKTALIEAAVISVHTEGADTRRSQKIVDAYGDQIRVVRGEVRHSLTGVDRCFTPGEDQEFRDCVETVISKVSDNKEAIARVRDNKYKMYGVVSADKKGKRVFKVANLLKHTKACEGIVCNTGGRSKVDLVDIMRRIGVKLTSEEKVRVRKLDEGRIRSDVGRIKGFKEVEMDQKGFEEVYVWGKYTKNRLCEMIEAHMRKIGILVE